MRRAFDDYAEMLRQAREPTVVTYSAVIIACEKG